MSTSSQAATAGAFPAAVETQSHTASLPWYCISVVLAAACIPIGALWDISWHSTIGRDTFWTPAHMMIYIGGALPGSVCGWLVLMCTFKPSFGEKIPTVRLWGFRGPIGAWVAIWGSFVMLVSAPFDNWWHDAYGLDVQILSPPHTLLALGMYGVAIGATLLIVSWQNRLPEEKKAFASNLFLFSCGVLVAMVTVILMEFTFPNHQHAAFFYKVVGAMTPLYLVTAARATGRRWAATISAGIYMLITAGMVWILPLFPAQPMLAPIYNPVTYMVPPPFPLLLIIPALSVDLIMQSMGRKRGFWRDMQLSVPLAVCYVVLLIGTQWPFSTFLLSPAAHNAFFAGDKIWSYGARVGPWCAQFWDLQDDPLTWRAVGIAIGLAAVHIRAGLGLGNWLSSVKR